jgi:cytochrome P450
MMRNADDYPEPERFNPERYLNADGEIDSKVRDPRTAVFGYGRRICPGRFFADTSLFLSVATLLATVDVVRAKDARGNEIVPVVDSTGGALSHPKPFPWAVRPRSAQATELLASSKGKFDMSE